MQVTHFQHPLIKWQFSHCFPTLFYLSSIQSGSFPSSWKCALAKPLHKGGSRDELSNYRPISLLPVASKTLESVVKDQVYSRDNFNLLYHWQSGFRPGHSTTTMLLHVTNEWFRALDNGLFVSIVFLDISKAFDTVNHDLLLSRLQNFDLNSVTCQWYQLYLLDRCQCTAIDSEHSEDLAVTFGVPPGICPWAAPLLNFYQSSPCTPAWS